MVEEQAQSIQPDAEQGKYVYCIIKTDTPREFGTVGIGGRGDRVYTVHYKEFAAVVSNCPLIVFDPTRGVNQPKARFAYLFPTANSALIQVRLKASLNSAQQAQAISLIRQAVRMPIFRLAYGGTYTVSGVPVVTSKVPFPVSK